MGRTHHPAVGPARGVADAYCEAQPLVALALRDGFVEWYDIYNRPQGLGEFPGAAGTLGQAVVMPQAWAKEHAGKGACPRNAKNNKERICTMKTNLTLLTTLLPTPWTSDRIVAMQRAALMLFAIGANVYALAFLRCAFANNQEDAVTGLSAAQTVEFQDCTINGQAGLPANQAFYQLTA